jgi:hypothetical protein
VLRGEAWWNSSEKNSCCKSCFASSRSLLISKDKTEDVKGSDVKRKSSQTSKWRKSCSNIYISILLLENRYNDLFSGLL